MKSNSEMNSFSSDDLSFDYIPGPIKKPCFDDLLDYDRTKNHGTYSSVPQVPKGVWSSDSSAPCLDSDSGEAGLFKTPKKESSALKKLKDPIQRVKKDGATFLKTKPILKPRKNKAIANKKKPVVRKKNIDKKKTDVVLEKIIDFSEFDNYELIIERTKKPAPFFLSSSGGEQISLEHHQNDANENLKISKNFKVPVHHTNQFSSPDIFATSDEASLPKFNNFESTVFPQTNTNSSPMCFQNSSSIMHTSTPHSYEKTHIKPVFPTQDELEKVLLDKTSICQKNRNITSRNPLCNIKNCVGNTNVAPKNKVDARDDPCPRISAVTDFEKKSSLQNDVVQVIEEVVPSVDILEKEELSNIEIEKTAPNGSDDLILNSVANEACSNVTLEVMESKKTCNNTLDGLGKKYLQTKINQHFSEKNQLEAVVSIKDSVQHNSPKELEAEVVAATKFPTENTQVICDECPIPSSTDEVQVTHREVFQSIAVQEEEQKESDIEIEKTDGSVDLFLNSVSTEVYSNVSVEATDSKKTCNKTLDQEEEQKESNFSIEKTSADGSDDLFLNSVSLEATDSKKTCNKTLDSPSKQFLHTRVNEENQEDKSVSICKDSHLSGTRRKILIIGELTPYRNEKPESIPSSSVEALGSSACESTDNASAKPARFSGRLRRKRQAEPENSLKTLELIDKSLKKCKVIVESLNLSEHSTSICSRSVNITLDKLTFLDQSCFIPENLSPYEEIFDTFIETTSTEKILKICEQSDVVDINSLISRKELMTAKKIGEGSYAEVFKIKCQSEFVVLKIVPVEGLSPSGEPQLSLDEALSEIIISKEINGMRNNPQNKAAIFIEVKRISYAQGKWPSKLLSEWTKFANTRGEDAINEDPAKLNDDQLYIIFHYAYGGMDLEHYKFSKGSEITSVIKQLSLGLAAAELACKFEHRDLHEGNILVTKTRDKYAEFVLEGRNVRILTNGCNVKVIDFTLSRLDKDDTPIFKDLDDPGLFTGTGDAQYDVYRAMKYETKEEWHAYTPVTNVLWLSFLMNRLCERHSKLLKKDKNSFKMIKTWSKDIESCESAKDFVYKSLVNFENESCSF